MRSFGAIRRVKRKIGRGLKGGRLLLGPYVANRDGPVVFAGITLATATAVGGFSVFGVWPGLVLVLALVALILVATAWVMGVVRGIPDWPPLTVRLQARRNQLLRKPVYIAGRGGTPPKSVVAGGRIEVQP
ncbi:hypothetical protein [Mycolicibacterium fortuitum]|uniref:hypothetical protein n=1 Tax=Mycolicibacterium fortuitum TaxID=1766 RepID=UPI001CE02DD4|nr:hypothetical protein [Mycolicibacterium fortuitum]MCA4726671.1 hypothetical protein [Mycolicibacterium fortuitum]